MKLTQLSMLKVGSQFAGVLTTIAIIAALPKETYGIYVVISSIFIITLNTYNNGSAIVEGRISASSTQTENSKSNTLIKKALHLSLPILILEVLSCDVQKFVAP